MATASVPNLFINGSNADANEVNANFSSIVNWLNTNVVQPDLANFTIFPTLPTSNPSNAYHAAHKNYVDLWLPAGSIIQYGGVTAPSGWVVCDGTAYDGANPIYSRLYGAIGLNYGGSGVNSFQVPDLKGRVPVGLGAGAGLTNRSIAAKGGAETHVLTEAELAGHVHTQPQHVHGQPEHQHAVGARGSFDPSDTSSGVWGFIPTTYTAAPNGPTGGQTVDSLTGLNGGQNTHLAGGENTGSTGGNAAHNNMQPFIVVNYIIRL